MITIKNIVYLFLLLLFSFPNLGFAQQENRRTLFYTVRTTPGTSASDTSFAVGTTSTVNSKIYKTAEFISYGVNVTSSGTVDIAVNLQYHWQNEHGTDTPFITLETKTITATGLTSFIPSVALPNKPCRWRLSIVGQGSNDASTACRVYFAGDNPNQSR